MGVVLFIRGFNTDNTATSDTYSHIREVLSQHHIVHYFQYSVNDDISSVYRRLCEVIESNAHAPGPDRFRFLIGHSMGGGLLMRFIADHYASEPRKYRHLERLILLMPLLYRTEALASVCRVPLIEHALVPKAWLLPASRLFPTGNVLNDDYSLLPVKQIVGMVRDLMLDAADVTTTLNRSHVRQRVVLLYAKDEAFSVIPTDILRQIHNVHYVSGFHECFNGLGTSREFFGALLSHVST